MRPCGHNSVPCGVLYHRSCAWLSIQSRCLNHVGARSMNVLPCGLVLVDAAKFTGNVSTEDFDS